jgi:hypothetical protein
MDLLSANYYSPEADAAYMSVSQYRRWVECAAGAHAWYVRRDPLAEFKVTEAMALSSYGDALLLDPPTVPEIMKQYSEYLTLKNGSPSTGAMRIIGMVEFVRKQFPDFASIMSRSSLQRIITFRISGVQWKGRLDILDTVQRMIWDVKMVADLLGIEWVPRLGQRGNFIAASGYVTQLAVYQEGVAQAVPAGEGYGVGIIGVQKPTTTAPIPMLRAFRWTDQVQLYDELKSVAAMMPRIAALKSQPDIRSIEHDGEEPRLRCGTCSYCRATEPGIIELPYSDPPAKRPHSMIASEF